MIPRCGEDISWSAIKDAGQNACSWSDAGERGGFEVVGRRMGEQGRDVVDVSGCAGRFGQMISRLGLSLRGQGPPPEPFQGSNILKNLDGSRLLQPIFFLRSNFE